MHVPLMDSDAQQLYLNAMISNPEIFSQVSHIIQPKFFDPQFAKGVKFIQDYFRENRTVPASSVFTTATKIPTDNVVLPKADRDFIAGQIAEFCRFQACIDVIKKATGKDGYFETGDLGTMVAQLKNAIEIGLITDIGIDYFEDPLARLTKEEEDPVISTGWKSVDAVIGGGIGRQELVLFLAPSGGGKSVSMLNLGLNWLEMGLNGAYISLEMRDRKVALRTDQMIARMSSSMINMNKTQVAHEIQLLKERTNAQFFIKRMREGTTTANDITAYINQVKSTKKIQFDFIIVDYLDIMAPIQRGYGDNMFLKDKFVSEEVRAIGFDENAVMVSGSQLGKHATSDIEEGRKMHQGDVQGGSSKTNTADLMIATVKTDAMHVAGEYRFEFPKARNSDAATKQVLMKWDNKTLRISDMDGEKLEFKPKRKALDLVDGGRPGQKRVGLAGFDKFMEEDKK